MRTKAAFNSAIPGPLGSSSVSAGSARSAAVIPSFRPTISSPATLAACLGAYVPPSARATAAGERISASAAAAHSTLHHFKNNRILHPKKQIKEDRIIVAQG
ncbi:MAG: hypothetical protein HPY59_00875 [Anaerolineae bacterium]|nr:hypothetical protein [Anaerolineae bacterium]